jgi:hypothetical protein
MIIENEIVNGDLQVTEEYDLQGIVTGNVTVLNESVFCLHGLCKKNLFIEEGSKVYLYGMVCGSVYNNGGYLEVHGLIKGKLIKEAGETVIKTKQENP